MPTATLPTLRNSPCFVLLALRSLISRLALCGISRPCSLRGNHGGQLDARLYGGATSCLWQACPHSLCSFPTGCPVGGVWLCHTACCASKSGSLRSLRSNLANIPRANKARSELYYSSLLIGLCQYQSKSFL